MHVHVLIHTYCLCAYSSFLLLMGWKTPYSHRIISSAGADLCLCLLRCNRSCCSFSCANCMYLSRRHTLLAWLWSFNSAFRSSWNLLRCSCRLSSLLMFSSICKNRENAEPGAENDKTITLYYLLNWFNNLGHWFNWFSFPGVVPSKFKRRKEVERVRGHLSVM